MERLKDKDWLHQQYVDNLLSTDKIANVIGCGKTTVHRALKKHGIVTRDISDINSMKNPKLSLVKSRNWLYDAYIIQHKTPETIAKELGCGPTTITRYLEEHNIPIRNVSEAKLGKSLELLSDRTWMINSYVVLRKSLEDIANELDCSTTAVAAYLKSHGVKIRSISECCTIEAKNKLKSTMLDRYGVENPAQINMQNKTILEDRNWLCKKYIDNNQTTVSIGSSLGVDPTTVANYLRKHNIPISHGYSVSSPEHKIRDFLSTNNIKYETSNRTLIKPLELDIYVPSRAIAIEVHGLYWHSEVHKEKNYHENKRIRCNNAGIRLIQLYEDDIRNNWELLQRFLLNALGQTNDERIFARKCQINHNPKISECKELLNRYHIQGYASQNKALTLEHNNETVAVMLFKGDVLTRYATSKKVIGGFGKLLNACGLDSVITFIDLDTFSGETYFKTGFVVDKYLQPDYKYIVNGRREHKFNYRLKKFRDHPELLYEEGKTERELALMNKLYRIYDSGKYRLIWTRNNTHEENNAR